MKNRANIFGTRVSGTQLVIALQVVIAASWVAMHMIQEPPQMVYTPANPQVSPYGYTWSLILFILPCSMLLFWYWRNRKNPRFPYHGRAALITGTLVISTYFLLDIFFANIFFLFPNSNAVLGLYLWGWDFKTGHWEQNIPIEEFLFYGFGFLAILLCYGWSSRTLFLRYTRSGRAYTRSARKINGVVKYSFIPIVLGVCFILVVLSYRAFVYRKTGLPPGFPGYFFFLAALIVIPCSIFYQAIRDLMNLQAFTFTIISLLLVSLLWEVTLALPYGWWSFQPQAMLGLYIRPWFNLPIEEPLLWVAAGWMNVTLFEFVRLYLAQGRSLRKFLFGSRKPMPAICDAESPRLEA